MIRHIAHRLAPVSPNTPGSEAYDRFEREPDTLAIAVVDGDGRAIGLVERNAFFLKMASTYGRALFAGRPVSAVMDASPILVEADTPLGSFLAEAVEGSVGALLRGFIVVEDGRYLGVGSSLDLLVGAFHENQRRAADMADLADQRLAATHEAERALEALATARDAADAGNRAKSQFLATMSHEIRTPLNGVIGVASALGRTELSPRQREMVRLIESSAESLQVVLADVLDMARVEAGRMELSPEPFDLREAALDVAELFRARAEDKGLSLAVEVGAEVAARHVGDAVRIKQILGNLLSNAVKFTESGSIQLAISAQTGADGRQRLGLSVTDTGIGFDADTGKRLFQRFAQADGSITRRFGGAGLGLSISGALAELMGGSIEAVSTPGQGSTFTLTLTLPAAPPRAAAAAPDPSIRKAPESDHEATDGRSLRVLVAEDHEVNRRVVELMLQDLGAELVMAEDGVEALERFEPGAFDLVLMDMQMPRMGGLEATAAIRRREASDPSAVRTPIVMLTANALPEHEAAGRAAGADAFLTKPIMVADLLAAVHAALSPPATREEAAA